jgi:Flp pilus assembly protein TadG
MTIIKQILRDFHNDERGIATMEMVFLTPFFILWIVGSNSFFDAFTTKLRAAKATYTAIDLVSRQSSVGPTYISNVGSIFDSIVDADGTASSVIVTSVEKLEDDSLSVDWSVNAAGGGGIANAGAIPTALIPNILVGEHVILIQTSVPYIPKFAWANLAAHTFTNTIVVTPRFDPQITYDYAL